MASRGRILKYLAAALLAAFCLAFARTDTTEKSMVRAILLEPGEEEWTVGLLYQAPEASADSSEASDGIGFAVAQGTGLERALDNAASLLPLEANFRLCDYLLLMPGGNWQTLSSYESLVLARQCGRTSAQLAACDFTCQELSEATEEGEDLLTSLLQTLKRSKRALPRLYETRTDEGLLMPCLTMEETTLSVKPEGWFVSTDSSEEWDAQKTAVYGLLTGQGDTFTFWLGEHPLTLRRPLLGVEKTKDGSFASVKRGEERNIFPYQENADVMFNSATIYELSVLKNYIEPLLYQIKSNQEEYATAKRIIKFLDYFLAVNCDVVPKNSILKEFVGGSVLKV